MYVRSIAIANFRGIEHTQLEACGRLNVLIGKNNSGKSTILDAIDGFFQMVADGTALQLDSALGQEHDFRRGAHAQPIRISVQLRLTYDEFKATVEDVAAEAPQMRHALDSIPEDFDLLVTLIATRGERPYAYIERLALIHPDGTTEGERLLLAVHPASARELHENVGQLKNVWVGDVVTSREVAAT